MNAPVRPLVEQRPIAVPNRRYAARPDDQTELQAVIATMCNVPREALESFPDMLHLLRRLAGRVEAVERRLQVTQPEAPKRPRARLPGRPATDRAAIIAGVFGKAPRAGRKRSRTITTRRGRTVRVVERAAGQMELGL